MSLKIGVSGVRGIIGESLTEDVISDFAKAFGTFVHRPSSIVHRKRITVLIGRDTRQSGEFARKVVIDGLLSTGCGITDAGLAPTPTVLFLARAFKSDGAIIITASHNPREWNGLKFVRPDGTFLTKQQIEKLIQIYKSKKFREGKGDGSVFSASANDKKQNRPLSLPTLHLDAVVKAVDAAAIRKARFKVALDYCNGTGAVTTPYLLKKLGCNVVAINASPDGKFAHNPEPTPKNLEQLAGFVKESKADVGFAQDPDADRLAVVSEKGVAIGEENTLALAVKHVLSRSEERGTRDEGRIKVVVNLSTSRMIDDICKGSGARLYRSAVGETNVVDMMREKKAVIGGEGNGGVIFPAVNFGRDSFIGMALILEYMAKTGKSLSQLVADIKQYCIEKTKIDCPQEKIASILKSVYQHVIARRPVQYTGSRLREGATKQSPRSKEIASLPLVARNDVVVTTIDGIKIDYSDGWMHIRGSNTEPVIRIMAEADTKKKAAEYIDKILAVIKC